jgi:hypothetical protein
MKGRGRFEGRLLPSPHFEQASLVSKAAPAKQNKTLHFTSTKHQTNTPYNQYFRIHIHLNKILQCLNAATQHPLPHQAAQSAYDAIYSTNTSPAAPPQARPPPPQKRYV